MSEGWPLGDIEDDGLAGHPRHGEPENHLSGQIGWVMYEWANQPYFTLITIFLFSAYFANSFIVGDPATGQAYWGYTQAAAGVCIALLSPFLGAMADAAGPRKPWIVVFVIAAAIACCGLWIAEPGGMLAPVMAFVILASIAVEFVTTFANAMLPSIATERRMAYLSGIGIGVAQISGIVALMIVLFCFQLPGQVDLGFLPDQPMLGLDRAMKEDERIVGPLAGIWFLVFMVPLFIMTPDVPHTGLTRVQAMRAGLSRLGATFRKLRDYRNIAIYLGARMLYYDGFSAVFMFAGIIAGYLFGWGALELAVFGIIATLFAGLGGFLGGWLDARFGSRATLLMALTLVTLMTLTLVSFDKGIIFFVVEVARPDADTGAFGSTGEIVYLITACLFSLGVGPGIASSRTMLGRIAPREMMTEFFGLYALAGKATTFLAPLAIGIVTQMTGDQRIGLGIVLVFLVTGFVMLLFVKEERAAPVVH